MEDASVRLHRGRYQRIMQSTSPNLVILLTGLMVASTVALTVLGKPTTLSHTNTTGDNRVHHVTKGNDSNEIKVCLSMHQYRLHNDIRATVCAHKSEGMILDFRQFIADKPATKGISLKITVFRSLLNYWPDIVQGMLNTSTHVM